MIYYRWRAKPLGRQLCLISGVKWCQIVQSTYSAIYLYIYISFFRLSFTFAGCWLLAVLSPIQFPIAIANYFRALLGNNKSWRCRCRCRYKYKYRYRRLADTFTAHSNYAVTCAKTENLEQKKQSKWEKEAEVDYGIPGPWFAEIIACFSSFLF